MIYQSFIHVQILPPGGFRPFHFGMGWTPTGHPLAFRGSREFSRGCPVGFGRSLVPGFWRGRALILRSLKKIGSSRGRKGRGPSNFQYPAFQKEPDGLWPSTGSPCARRPHKRPRRNSLGNPL